MRWEYASFDAASARRLSQRLGISQPCAALLAQRGWSTPEQAETFLKPHLRRLGDPFAVTHLEAAVKRVREAMRKDEEILVFGDYDVDGVTATTLLVSILSRFGPQPRYAVPLRQEEGYGLSRAALERVLEVCKPDLLIAVDCGTSSRREVAWLAEQGVDVIIIDHHTGKEALPEEAILVNPHVYDAPEAPWRELCAVGLAFKFVHGLVKAMRLDGDPIAQEIDLRDYLDLVALGTIADLVPLRGENRILARNGLTALKHPKRLGLQALFEVAGMALGAPVEPFDISFRLGPRINASGRLDDAQAPIEMLLGSDFSACRRTAQELDGFNQERQRIEAAITEEAIQQVEETMPDTPGILVYGPGWHTGVVGIVASRLMQRFHRPALVLGDDSDGEAKGSGRSIPGVNLVEVLQDCRQHLTKWGGHPMAVGVSTRREAIDALRTDFNAALSAHLNGSVPDKTLAVDLELGAEDLTERLLAELERLAPFGQANPEPVFALRGARLDGVSTFGRTSQHLRFTLARRNRHAPLAGIAWR
ncbi:MAG: single-stranded-DNA-specific exonuclease RecJ, partial [Opitutales bacterium]